MNKAGRSDVVSSFTVIKGALIPETYAAFERWDLSEPVDVNLCRLKEGNLVGASSENWLRDLVKVLHRRFDPDGRDHVLVELAAAGCELDTWKPLMLWHMTRDEFLVRDFLIDWLFPRFQDSTHRVRADDVLQYLRTLSQKGAQVAEQWSESTSKRVAAGLLKIASDFGFLQGSVTRTFSAYHLREESFMYLLHAMMEHVGSATKVIDSPDWRMYLMSRQDVEAELIRLHQFRKLHFEAAGSLAQLALPCGSAAEYAKRLVA